MGTKANIKISLVTLIFLLAIASISSGRTIYVDANTADNNDGSNWAKAYKYLQDALADANISGDVNEIWVAQGIYKPDANSSFPDGTGDREATFQLINGVALYGGYAGFGESDPNTRDIELYETILSGGDNEPGVNSNSYHVVTGSGTDANALLGGFTITRGAAYGDNPDWYGGGMHIWNGSPTVINCTFRYNKGWYGAGWYNRGGNPTLINCKFINNWAGQWGGGMVTEYGSAILTSCSFSGNETFCSGGGMMLYRSNLVLTNCTFNDNESRLCAGGAICSQSNDLTLLNCTFAGNSATDGKAISCYSDSTSSTINIANCIVWDGTPTDGNEIISRFGSEPLVLTVSYSNMQGGEAGINMEVGTLNWGEGNIYADPCFADPCNGDYHLKSQAGRWDPCSESWVQDDVTSPCIDAGDPSSSIGWEPFPNGGRINMGAYGGTEQASKSYFGAPVCQKPIAGDINGDCKVDFKDFAIMAYHWLEDNNP